jgi:hypothetical protein
MTPPDLYRSEAFAEDLPEGGYEPLALVPVRVTVTGTAGLPGLLRTGRALWTFFGSRLSRRTSGAAVQLA